MVQLFWLSSLAALLIATAWISILGRGAVTILSGIAIRLVDFVIVFHAQQKQLRDGITD